MRRAIGKAVSSVFCLSMTPLLVGATVDVDVLSEEFGGNAKVKFVVESYLDTDPFLN
jgi:hypothetical protein